MSALGDFLEVIYGPTTPFQTVRAVIRSWQDLNAFKHAPSDGKAFGRRKNSAPQPPRFQEEDILVWMNGLGRVRIETTRRRDGRSESSLTVANGEQWWARDFQGHVETNILESKHSRRPLNLTDAERHFFSASLREYFVSLALETLGTARTAGRECLRVRAVPRPDNNLWPHWLPFGADEYELHADPERGVLLSIVAKLRGEVFETIEVLEVMFDEAIDDALFTYEPRQGEQIRPPDVIAEHITLAAAVKRMPFTVLVPTRVPDSEHARLEVMFHPSRINDSRARLTLLCSMGEDSVHINQSETPASLDEYEWETVERNGRRMEISDPGPDQGTRGVRLEHLGTHINFWSELDRESILDLAASLEPATHTIG